MTDLKSQLEASLELETLQAEVKRLREALEPFAKACNNRDGVDASDLSLADFRHAREALSAKS